MLNLNDFLNRLFLRELFSYLVVENDARLLDLGCGNSPYEHIYSGVFPLTIKTDLEIRGPGVDVIANVDRLPFIDRSFDVVLLSEVIEHVPDDLSALREIHRILKPNGHLILTWPFLYQMHELPNDFRRYTEFGMRSLLDRVGFDIVVLKRRGDLLSVFLTVIGSIICGATNAASRIPVLGFVFKPLYWATDWLTSLACRAVASVQYRLKHLNPIAVGEGLRGLSGAMALSPLGYCLIAKKVTRSS